jgi:hypothetical protein
MARPRKPPELKVLDGSYLKNPQRKPKRMTKRRNELLGDPPDDFTEAELKCWDELSYMTSHYTNVIDRWAAESLCRLMARMRDRSKDLMDAARLGKLINLLSAMGMTPVDRGRLQVSNEKPEGNPYDEFQAANTA